MQNKKFHFCLASLIGILLAGTLAVGSSLTVYAAQTYEERIEMQRSRTIESNEIEGWPDGPVVTADSAILMEAGTGTILYAKNIHAKQYPASCTKILTCLIAAERCKMDEIVTMSHKAVYDTPLDSSYISLDVGNQITMEQALSAVLISSANNVAFAVAEHIVDSNWEDFAEVMNERARELGCVDSNFVNPNGLPDENHYTSAYDLAMIGRAFFDNELLSKISRTSRLHLPPTDTQPKDIIENSKNRLLPGQSMAYEYLVGSKTGYTNAARSCLVSCAEKDGLKLICVVLKDESPTNFADTLALFEYGFSNFKSINISETETQYHISTADTFYSNNDILGNSKPLLELNASDYVVMPITASFSDAVSSISYDVEKENQVALITYTYHDVPVGSASIDFISANSEEYLFAGVPGNDAENSSGSASSQGGQSDIASDMAGNNPSSADDDTENDNSSTKEQQVVLINIKEAFLWTAIVLAVMALLWIVITLLRRRIASNSRRRHGRYSQRFGPAFMTLSEDLQRKRRAAAKRANARRRNNRRLNQFKDHDF